MDAKDPNSVGSLQTTFTFLQQRFKQMGITRVANVTGLDTLEIPVAACFRPNSKLLSVSQGKGLSWEKAAVSAIMESVEAFHAENVAPPQLTGSFNELSKNHPIISPEQFNLGKFRVENLLDYKIDWIEARNLITQQTAFLPYALVCLDSTRIAPEYGIFTASSNGLAGGQTLEQAISHGMLEVIERDAYSKWNLFPEDKKNKTQIDLNTIDAPITMEIIRRVTAANIWVNVWDISSELKLPAFKCTIKDHNIIRGLNHFGGYCAHCSKEKALLGSILEAIQSRLTLIIGSRDDALPIEYERQKSGFFSKTVNVNGSFSYQQCPNDIEVSVAAKDQVHKLLMLLTEHNCHDVLVIDHTRADLEIPIAHTFIPKLVHHV
jgi:ribosomal protein S12 methylthiotransferase accessory factor